MTEMKHDLSGEMQDELEVLIAVGLYKTKSETLKDYVRQLGEKYKEHVKPIEEVRKELDEALGERSLSEEVLKLREEEMH